MSHLHGVAWFNTQSDFIQANGFKNCFLPDNSFNLEDPNLPRLIDYWTSCSLANKTKYENSQDNESESDPGPGISENDLAPGKNKNYVSNIE